MTAPTDRPTAIRRALRDLVAARGFHGASMSAVAREAGVAAGTAYVHYGSKDDLVVATYLEVKRELGQEVMAALDPAAEPRGRYLHMMTAMHEHLRREPERARFLTQLEESPFHERARAELFAAGDPIAEEATRPDLAERLVDLPLDVIYQLSMGVIVRIVASGVPLTDAELHTLIDATWRAITTAEAA